MRTVRKLGILSQVFAMTLAVATLPVGPRVAGAVPATLSFSGPHDLVVAHAGGRAHTQGGHALLSTAAPSPLLRMVPISAGVALGVDEVTQRVFVSSGGVTSNFVSMLDASSGAVLRTVKVATVANVLVVNAATNRVFVATRAGISVLDARTGLLLRTTRLPGGAVDMVIAHRSDHLFTTGPPLNDRYTLLHILDARSGRLLRTLHVSPDSAVTAVDQRTQHVFMTTDAYGMNLNQVSMLDGRTGTILRTLTVAPGPDAVALDATTRHVFVVSALGPSVNLIATDTGRLVRTTPVNPNLQTIGVDSQMSRVFVPTIGTMDVLDARTGALVHSVTGVYPATTPVVIPRTGEVATIAGVGVDETTGRAKCVCLLVEDGRTGAVRQQIPTGVVYPFGFYNRLAVDGRTHRLFAVEEKAIAVFDTARLR